MITLASPAARRTLHPAHVAFGIALLLGAVLLVLRWHQDWNGSEGTYALTARALLNGDDLYGSVALATGSALTLASTLKVGTTLTVMPPVEALLLPLAVAGAAAWLDDGGVLQATAPAAVRCAVVGVLVALLLAQSLSLLAQPRRGGVLFVRPFSAPAWSVQMTGDEVDARVAALRRCPRGRPSGERPTVTFRAGRRMPGDQPDVFLPSRARRLADVRARVEGDRPRCPEVAR